METSIGRVEATWGVNRWVLLDTPRGTIQRQVAKRRDLAVLLAELGLEQADAEQAAAALWRQRPADAGFEAATRDEAPWYATGLPTWAIFAILAGLVALYLVFRLRNLL